MAQQGGQHVYLCPCFCCAAWFVPGNRCCVHACVACCSQPVVCILCWRVAGQQCWARCPLISLQPCLSAVSFMLGINRCPWMGPTASVSCTSSEGCHARGVAAPAASQRGFQAADCYPRWEWQRWKKILTLPARLACTSKCMSFESPWLWMEYHPPWRRVTLGGCHLLEFG